MLDPSHGTPYIPRMPFALAVPSVLLQAATLPDTIIARTVPVRGLFEYTSGILQILVLLLGIGALVALVLLLLTVRKGIDTLNNTVERLSGEVRPLLKNANEVVGDARAVVARVRSDVDRVSDAASAVSDQLLHAAEVTAERVDDVNAVLDVLQDELEDMAISTVSTVRGATVGAKLLAAAFGKRGRGGKRRRPRSERPDRVDRGSDSSPV